MTPELDERTERFIRAVPKAEMHLHLEGAARWRTIRELHPEGGSLPETPPWYSGGRFSDFHAFREVFRRYVKPVTGTPELVERLTREVLSDLAAQGVMYVELIAGLRFHTERGMTVGEVLASISRGVGRAEAESGISAGIILGMQRRWSEEEALAFLEGALRVARPDGRPAACGVDLMGDDRERPARDFARVFAFARESGLRLRAHAGELSGSASVREAIDELGVEHISHGARAAESPELTAEIAARGVYLHLCPTSNVWLGGAPSPVAHPLRKLFDAGCRVTVNSDDPLLFGTTITEEFRTVARHQGFGMEEIAALCWTAIEASPLPERRKLAILELIDREAASSAQ